MRSYAALVEPRLGPLMSAAEESDAPCILASVVDEADKNACTKLYNILLMVCKEKALNEIVNAGQNEGLEAWRQLCL
eukprot:1122141-Karenia_brevis.AAC.1